MVVRYENEMIYYVKKTFINHLVRLCDTELVCHLVRGLMEESSPLVGLFVSDILYQFNAMTSNFLLPLGPLERKKNEKQAPFSICLL